MIPIEKYSIIPLDTIIKTKSYKTCGKEIKIQKCIFFIKLSEKNLIN